jgi:hypothetical protein
MIPNQYFDKWELDLKAFYAMQKVEEERRRSSADPEQRKLQVTLDEMQAGMDAFDNTMAAARAEYDRQMEEKKDSQDPSDRLEWAVWKKRKTCKHENLPPVKSHYSDEMVMRGRCPDCDVNFLELD